LPGEPAVAIVFLADGPEAAVAATKATVEAQTFSDRTFDASASADYVLTVRPGDRLRPELLAVCVEALSSASDAAFAYFDYWPDPQKHAVVRPGEPDLYRLLESNPISHCLLVRASDWADAKTLPTTWDRCLHWLSTDRSGVYVPQALVRHAEEPRTPDGEAVVARHPELFSPEGRLKIKRRWSPSICVVAASGPPPDLSNQTLQDYQLLQVPRESDALAQSRAEAFFWLDGGGVLQPQALEEALLALQDADWVTWRDTGDAPPPSFHRAAGPLGVTRDLLAAPDPKPSGIVRRLPWPCRIGAPAAPPEGVDPPPPARPPKPRTESAWAERIYRHLENAELLEAETWKRSPGGALARLIPLRIKEAINERAGRPVFDLSFYLKFQPRSVAVDGRMLEPLDYLTRLPGEGKKRVGFVTPHLGYGGAETVLLEMAKQLDRQRTESILVAPHSEDARLVEQWRQAVDHVYDLARLGPVETVVGRLLSLASAWRLDVLVVQNSPAAYAVLPALKQHSPALRIADVLHIVDPEWDLFDATVEVADAIDRRVVISEQGRRRLVEMATPEQRIRLIPNGVDLSRFDPERYHAAGLRLSLNVPPDALIVAFVARLAKMKRPLLLSSIADAVRRRMPEKPVVFAVAGTGPLEAELRQRIARDGTGDSFRLLGHLAEPAELLAASDLLIMPSDSEGVPLALLESLAMGVPVVASRAGAIEEELTSDFGVLVETGPDEQHRFAQAIVELARDPERRERMSQACRAAAREKHSLERARQAYRELWAELTAPGLDSAR